MKQFLKLGASLLLASLFSTTQGTAQTADDYQCCCPASIYLTTPCNTFDIQAQALFLQPSGSKLDYAAVADPEPLASPNWQIHDIKPSYQVGFEIAASANIHDKYSKVTLAWEHFNSKNSSSFTVPAGDMVGPMFEIGPEAHLYTQAKGHTTFRFDEISLNYGVLVQFGCSLQTNLYAGVDGASIKQTMSNSFSSADLTYIRSLKVPSSFIGAGPQLGIDANYQVWDGFNVTGAASTSLLVGTLKNHTDFSSTSPLLPVAGAVSPNNQRTSVTDTTQIVPAFKGKLGIAYTTSFFSNFAMTLEAGYQAQVYLNAVQSVDMASEVVPSALSPGLITVDARTVGVFAETFQRTISNFALAGPYISLDIGF